MVKVQCELIHLKKRNSDFYLKLRKDERQQYLERTIEWLRGEALSLAKNIRELKDQNEELKKQIDMDKHERAFLIDYTKSTKKHNRVLS